MNFAIVGCGEIATTHARALSRLGTRAALKTCCDVEPERAEQFGERFGVRVSEFEDILSDPGIDAVVVCTPSGRHAEVGVSALLAGKHVIVEKPMDVTVEACDSLLVAQRASRRTLGVVCQRRFDPAAVHVKQAVETGALGRLIAAECRVVWYRTQQYYDSGDWRGTWKGDGGGCLMNQGLHSVDLLRWICGQPRTVYARAATIGHERIEVEDVICATLSFESGGIGTILVTTAAYPGLPARIAFHGTRGSAVLEGDALGLFAPVGSPAQAHEPPKGHAMLIATGGTKAATEAARNATGAEPAKDDWTEGHVRQLRDFVDAVERGASPLVDGVQGRRAVELVTAIYRSARLDEVVTLEG